MKSSLLDMSYENIFNEDWHRNLGLGYKYGNPNLINPKVLPFLPQFTSIPEKFISSSNLTKSGEGTNHQMSSNTHDHTEIKQQRMFSVLDSEVGADLDMKLIQSESSIDCICEEQDKFERGVTTGHDSVKNDCGSRNPTLVDNSNASLQTPLNLPKGSEVEATLGVKDIAAIDKARSPFRSSQNNNASTNVCPSIVNTSNSLLGNNSYQW
jgi:hypothetical protein